jgi:hypothetical protein
LKWLKGIKTRLLEDKFKMLCNFLREDMTLKNRKMKTNLTQKSFTKQPWESLQNEEEKKTLTQ